MKISITILQTIPSLNYSQNNQPKLKAILTSFFNLTIFLFYIYDEYLYKIVTIVKLCICKEGPAIVYLIFLTSSSHHTIKSN